jgi:pyruvate dehydrogenase E2 component (dihydrolipoamide acetyltransferase)
MASEVKLPQLGENISGGDVLDLKVAVGDTVAKGQTLLEVEAEKSTVEVPAPIAGRIAKLLVKKGDAIEVGNVLCLIEDQPGQSAAPSKKEEPPKPRPASEVPASVNGNVRDGKTMAPQAAHEARPEMSTAPKGQDIEQRNVAAGPATRRLARELGIDLRLVRGTAPSGRVTQEDVKAYVRDLASSPLTRAGGVVEAPPLRDFEHWGPIERKPLDGVRRKTAEQMRLSWSLVPHVTQHDQADITELEAFRKQQDARGPKITVTAFALKAAAVALKQFPQVNSSLDLANGQLVLKHYFHIGVAVDTERGLLVPVIRDVDKKSIHDLAQELANVADRARQKKVSADEMRGGTFTITNLGGIGGTGFTPIVNYPEVAILGLSRGRLQPVFQDGQFVPRLMLPLSLSYDHRVIDGADAARFTRRIAELLENPLVMLLHA